MNNLLKCELVMLPANQNSGDLRLYNNKLGYKHNPHSHNGNYIDKPQHLYITSDRPIKDGDYITDGEGVYQFNNVNARRFLNKGGYKKIEATTDYLKIPINWEEDDNIPQIPESFIQAYIKNYNLGTKIEKCYLELDYRGIKANVAFDGNYEGTCNKCHKYYHWMGTSGMKCYCESNSFIKTRNDDTVIIHQIKDKFTRDEVLEILKAHTNHINRCDLLIQSKEWFNKNY